MKQLDSFESRHTDHFFTRITVQTATQRELTRADAFTRWWDGHANTKQCCEIQWLNSVMNTNDSVIQTS